IADQQVLLALVGLKDIAELGGNVAQLGLARHRRPDRDAEVHRIDAPLALLGEIGGEFLPLLGRKGDAPAARLRDLLGTARIVLVGSREARPRARLALPRALVRPRA